MLVDRALFYEPMNQFIKSSYALLRPLVLARAAEMDARAAADGVDSIAPLYGMPVPLKGTMATKVCAFVFVYVCGE